MIVEKQIFNERYIEEYFENKRLRILNGLKQAFYEYGLDVEYYFKIVKGQVITEELRVSNGDVLNVKVNSVILTIVEAVRYLSNLRDCKNLSNFPGLKRPF